MLKTGLNLKNDFNDVVQVEEISFGKFVPDDGPAARSKVCGGLIASPSGSHGFPFLQVDEPRS